MDEALSKALEFSNITATLNTQKRILHEKYLGDLVLYHNGGKFTVTKELLNFCHILGSDKTILVDDNNTPVQIDNLSQFKTLAHQKYADATNVYLASYKEITTKRNVEGMVDV